MDTPHLLLTVLLGMTAPQHALSTDPFQRTALKALSGSYGELRPWQRAGYERGLRLKATASRTAWLTGYYATEGHDGRVDCRGRLCTYRTAAANTIPQGSFIWTRYGIRQVMDRGARSNDRIARRKGAALWCDYWYPSGRDCPFGGSKVTIAAVVGR